MPSRLSTGQDRYQIWTGLVGSQTAEEFWAESQAQGATTYREAALRYIEHLKEYQGLVSEAGWTEEDVPVLIDMLVEVMEEKLATRTIESDGDYHSVKLLIAPDSVEVRGGFTPEIGPEDEVESALTQAAEAAQKIVEDIETAGILASVAYEDGDTVVWADVTLTDGRTVRIGVHTDSGKSVTAELI